MFSPSLQGNSKSLKDPPKFGPHIMFPLIQVWAIMAVGTMMAERTRKLWGHRKGAPKIRRK